MQDEGIIIRPLTGKWGAPQAIRITVGTPEQNRQCVATLKKVTDKVSRDRCRPLSFAVGLRPFTRSVETDPDALGSRFLALLGMP